MNNPIDFFNFLFKNKKTTLTGREAIALQYLHPEKGAINTGDYCTTQDIANLAQTESQYKMYVAKITSPGGAQIFNIDATFENTIGDIVWTYSDTGTFVGTLSGAFPELKTIGFISNVPIVGTASITWTNSNSITIYTNDSTGTESNNILSGAILEIRVYN